MNEETPVTDPARDLQQADSMDWPHRCLPEIAGREAGVIPVVIKQSILNAIHLHGQQHTDVEICGVLVGRGYRDEQGPYVYIEGAIRGDHAESQVAQVTFTSETWSHIHAILDTAFPGQRILAWYHTHPGFGIFLSGMDLFIHENFFGSPEQFAVVYDPLSGDEGLFVWQAGKPVKGAFLIEVDTSEDPPQRPAGASRHPSATAGAFDLGDLATEVRKLRNQQRMLTVCLVALGLFAIASPLVLFRLLMAPQIAELHGRVQRLEAALSLGTENHFLPSVPPEPVRRGGQRVDRFSAPAKSKNRAAESSKPLAKSGNDESASDSLEEATHD